MHLCTDSKFLWNCIILPKDILTCISHISHWCSIGFGNGDWEGCGVWWSFLYSISHTYFHIHPHHTSAAIRTPTKKTPASGHFSPSHPDNEQLSTESRANHLGMKAYAVSWFKDKYNSLCSEELSDKYWLFCFCMHIQHAYDINLIQGSSLFTLVTYTILCKILCTKGTLFLVQFFVRYIYFYEYCIINFISNFITVLF